MDWAFERHGLLAPGYERTRTIVGLDLFEAVALLAPENTPERTVQDLCATYKEVFVQHRSAPDFTEALYDGAQSALTALANDNWLLGVSTGKSRRGLDVVLDKHDLRQYFDTIWCADDGPGKPHPFMCLEAMGAVGAEPHQTLMIGDAVHDMRMAKAAGITALGVTWGFGNLDELRDAGADDVFTRFEDLNLALQGFSPILAAAK